MTAPSQRYLSIWLRRLSADQALRHCPAPDDTPLVIAGPVKSALRISALNDAAAALGLKVGIPLADARAMYPAIRVEQSDPASDLAWLEAIADWCDRYTPLVGLDPPDGLLLNISGCAHLFGGEQELGRDMIARLARQGFQARLGIASTAGCAWAVARYAEASHVPDNMTRAALLPLPLAALRLGEDTVSALAQSGLKYVADIVERPRSSLAARFGQQLLRRLDQALGHEEEPIKPRLPVPSFVVERRFPEPIALQSDVLATVEQLARELGHIMERRGEGARLLRVALFRTDGKVHRLQAGTAEPLRDPERIRRVFVERLSAIGDEYDPGFGYDVIRLSVLASECLDPAQSSFSGDDHRIELAHLVDRLSARFGSRRLTRLVPRDTHIPEFAIAAVPAQLADRACAADLIQQGSQQDCHQDCHQASLSPARPLRLFERPEPIEAVAEVPDGPPVRFRWRRVLHEVAASEGPERIAMEWWRDAEGRTLTRDYFRIESRDGIRAWLYREGLYGIETSRPHWFLHGLFA